jgi:hypothetical protein
MDTLDDDLDALRGNPENIQRDSLEGDKMIHRFRLDQEALDVTAKKRVRLNMFVLVVMFVLIVIVVGFSTRMHSRAPIYIQFLGIMALTFTISILFSRRRILSRHKKIWQGYELTITDEYLTRSIEYTSFPDVTIYWNDIKKVQLTNKGDYLLYGNQQGSMIDIPVQIERYDLIVEFIKKHHHEEITAYKKYVGYLKIAGVMATLGCVAVLFLSDNVLLQLTAGLIALAGLAYVTYHVLQSKVVQKKFKVFYVGLLIFVLAKLIFLAIDLF